jgi:predicted alpha/beta-hydrolase family hydrolase
MRSETRSGALATEYGDVPLIFDGDPRAAFRVVLAHGAGAGMQGDFLKTVAKGLADRGLEIVRFNFPYVERGRKSPDRRPVLEATWRRVLEHVSDERGERIIVGGKSLGGRMASHVVAAGWPCAGLLLLGYPLHPPGRPDRLRSTHLTKVSVPMLFVSGSRDPLCRLEILRRSVHPLGGRATIAVIEDGDHSFRVRSTSGRTTTQAWHEVVEASHAWISSLCA